MKNPFGKNILESDKAQSIKNLARGVVDKSMDTLIHTMDQNGNGTIDIEDLIIMGLRVPGIKIDRSDFLRKELFKYYSPSTIDAAIRTNPAKAGIPQVVIDNIADEVIQYERNCVTGISAALGTPGGVAMAATLPADIAQYYGYMLRTAQKLLYLYGFPEIDTQEKNFRFDSETLNILILCLGVMYGVAGANSALRAMARALAVGVERKILRSALGRGVMLHILESIAGWFGKQMSKEVFAGFFKKAIPVVGGVIGGGLTYLSFKPCCDKLKASLRNTQLSDPYGWTKTEDDIIEVTELTLYNP